MTRPNERYPLDVEAGLEGAVVRVLVERQGWWSRFWGGPHQILEFRADAGGALLDGRRVRGSADYQVLSLDGRDYRVVGGLTKGEHRRLVALLEGRDRGGRGDVPDALSGLRR